jgi:type III secretion system FlhB-like substrate exporter
MTAKRQSAATNRPLEKAIVKLARNPVVVKKLVLVCHPDKCPEEVSESATELFRFLQGIRENAKL